MKEFEEIIKEWKVTIFIGLGILVLGLILRLTNLTLLPIFGDEAIYIRWAQIMQAEPGLRFVPLSDGKQPLFMWVLMFLVTRFSDPLFIGRLVSVASGIGTLVGIFTLSYYLFKSKKLALVSSLFWAISPYSVFYDRLALVDSMLTMFGVWTLLFAVLTAKTLRFDFAMLTGFALGGAFLTKSPAIFFVVLLPLTWMVSNWPTRKKDQHAGKMELIHLTKLAFLSLVTCVISLVMYNILRLGENFQMMSIRNKDYVFPISHLWQSPFDPLITNLNSVFDWLWKMGPSVLVIFILIALAIQIRKIGALDFKRIKRPKPEVALLFVWSTIPILVSSMYAKVFTARYILFSLPTIYIFAALVFVYFYKNVLMRKVIYFGMMIFVLQALFSDYLLLTQPEKAKLPRVVRSGYLEEWTAGTGIKEVAEFIRDEHNVNPGQKIVVGTEGYFGTLPDGLQIYLNDLREITVIGVGQPIRNAPESLIKSKNAGNKTYLVVNSTRLLGNAEELGLKLISKFPKAVRPDGLQESLLFFEVRLRVRP